MHILSKQHDNAGRNKNHPQFFHIPQKKDRRSAILEEIKSGFIHVCYARPPLPETV
jgi:hypothetical protein